MIAAQSDKSRLGSDRRNRLSPAELLKSLRHLLARNIVVDRCNRDIATVNDLGPVLIWVDAGTGVEAAE